jgi:hypothetical protein
MGCKVSKCQNIQISELLSMETGDHAMMDFLAATDIGKFTPNRMSYWGLTRQSSFSSFLVSFLLSFVWCAFRYGQSLIVSFVNGDEG